VRFLLLTKQTVKFSGGGNVKKAYIRSSMANASRRGVYHALDGAGYRLYRQPVPHLVLCDNPSGDWTSTQSHAARGEGIMRCNLCSADDCRVCFLIQKGEARGKNPRCSDICHFSVCKCGRCATMRAQMDGANGAE
jgi:hypothetical protein